MKIRRRAQQDKRTKIPSLGCVRVPITQEGKSKDGPGRTAPVIMSDHVQMDSSSQEAATSGGVSGSLVYQLPSQADGQHGGQTEGVAGLEHPGDEPTAAFAGCLGAPGLNLPPISAKWEDFKCIADQIWAVEANEPSQSGAQDSSNQAKDSSQSVVQDSSNQGMHTGMHVTCETQTLVFGHSGTENGSEPSFYYTAEGSDDSTADPRLGISLQQFLDRTGAGQLYRAASDRAKPPHPTKGPAAWIKQEDRLKAKLSARDVAELVEGLAQTTSPDQAYFFKRQGEMERAINGAIVGLVGGELVPCGEVEAGGLFVVVADEDAKVKGEPKPAESDLAEGHWCSFLGKVSMSVTGKVKYADHIGIDLQNPDGPAISTLLGTENVRVVGTALHHKLDPGPGPVQVMCFAGLSVATSDTERPEDDAYTALLHKAKEASADTTNKEQDHIGATTSRLRHETVDRLVLRLHPNSLRSDTPDSVWDNFELVWHRPKTKGRLIAISGDFKFKAEEFKEGTNAYSVQPEGAEPAIEIRVSLIELDQVFRILRIPPELAKSRNHQIVMRMLSFSPAGDILLGSFDRRAPSGSNESQGRGGPPGMVVWSVITGDVIKVISGSADPKTGPEFAEGWSILASISEDRNHVCALLFSELEPEDLDAARVRVPEPQQLMAYALEARYDSRPLTEYVAQLDGQQEPNPPWMASFCHGVAETFVCERKGVRMQRKDSEKEPEWQGGLSGRVCDSLSSNVRHFVSRFNFKNLGEKRRFVCPESQKQNDAARALHGPGADAQKRATVVNVFTANEEVGANAVAIRYFEDSKDFKDGGGCVAFVPNEKTVVAWSGAGELLHTFEHPRPVTSVDLNSDGSVLIVGVSGDDTRDVKGLDGEEKSVTVRMDHAKVVLYSLVTMCRLASFSIPHEVQSAKLLKGADKENMVVVRYHHGASDQTGMESDAGIELSLEEDRQVELDDKVDKVAVTNDGRFCLFMREKVGFSMVATSRMSSAQQGTARIQKDFYIVPQDASKLGMFKAVSGRPTDPGALPQVLCIALSGWGTTMAVGLCHTSTSSDTKEKKHYVVVFSALERPSPGIEVVEREPLVVAEVDMPPRALCINQDVVTVLTDSTNEANIGERDAILVTFNVFTGKAEPESRHRISGKTLGIADRGNQRVVHSSGRLQIENVENGDVLLHVQGTNHDLKSTGVSASGKLLVLPLRQASVWPLQTPRAAGAAPNILRVSSHDTQGTRPGASKTFTILDLNNRERFGPSRQTIKAWTRATAQRELQLTSAAELQLTLAQYKRGLAHWPLLFVDDWSEHLTNILDKCVAERDYGPLKVIIEHCPYFWARTEYIKRDKAGDENSRSLPTSPRPASGDNVSPARVASLKSTAASEALAERDRKSFWMQGLDSNDKILVQLLLEGVRQMVADTPDSVPVREMEQVTEFIKEAIEQGKMQDKVEGFLAELPLLFVPNHTWWPHLKEIPTASFPGGSVIQTTWRARSVPLAATAWTFLVNKKERGDRGYRYVSALPGLTRMDVLDAFVSSKASPALVDNETMRATIDALEDTNRDVFFRVPCDLSLLPFAVVLICFCGLVYWCVTPDVIIEKDGDSRLDQLMKESHGMAGFVMGAIAVAGHVIFIYFELVEGHFYGKHNALQAEMRGQRRVVADMEEKAMQEEKAKDMRADPDQHQQPKQACSSCVACWQSIVRVWETDYYLNYLRGAWRFLRGFWNFIPLLGNILGIAAFSMVVNNDDLVRMRIVSAFAMILLWFNLFNYLRAYRQGTALVEMLIQMLTDMGYFVGVVAILLVSFAGGFYSLHGKIDPKALGLLNENTCIEEPEDNEFLELSDAVARTFLMSIMGDFDVDALRSPYDMRDDTTGALTNASFIFFFLLVFFVTVVALNALIALMSSTYARVEQSAQAVTYKQILTVVHDKLRFRLFHLEVFRADAKKRFERHNRWTHVLSPSESGSIPEGRGLSSANPLVTLKQELKDSQDRAHRQMIQLEELLIQLRDDHMGKVKDEIDGLHKQRMPAISKELAPLNELKADLGKLKTLKLEVDKMRDEELQAVNQALKDLGENQAIHTRQVEAEVKKIGQDMKDKVRQVVSDSLPQQTSVMERFVEEYDSRMLRGRAATAAGGAPQQRAPPRSSFPPSYPPAHLQGAFDEATSPSAGGSAVRQPSSFPVQGELGRLDETQARSGEANE